jgi:enoyl-CoA hydratase/carnithine racemase
LVSRVVPEDALEREGRDLAQLLAGAPASALALTKQLFYQLDGQSVEQGIALGARVNALARRTPEFRKAIEQFLART